eukprot:gb/GECG01010258.1/.p1 GENE.gb/GECG01010258.1/~~gb/GECG01010258.1/.p1  ORF type:complete len:575 (+),score=60.26 gb/GECG01010258.1/:1-1725(+)
MSSLKVDISSSSAAGSAQAYKTSQGGATHAPSDEGAFPRGCAASQPLSSQFEALWEKISPELMSYLESMDDPETPVVEYNSPSELIQKLDLKLPSVGSGLQASSGEEASRDICSLVRNIMQTSVRTASARFFDKLYVGSDAVGMLSELLTASMNTNMHTYAVCPAFAVIEVHLLQELRRLVGLPAADVHDGDGIFCPGGSYGNMLAMLCARDKVLPTCGKKGLIGYTGPQLVSFTSAQSHYSIARACGALGLGSENVVKVPCDKEGRMIPGELDRLLREYIASGKQPFFINATAGTTVTGAFDPFDKIADIIEKHQGTLKNQFGENASLWLHIDGSWGGAVLMSSKYNHYLNGAGRADSFVFNPHKMLGVPLQCSALLMRESSRLARTCASNAEYLFHPSPDAAYDLGDKTLQCGRKVDCLKLFLSWRYYGTSGFGERVDHAFRLAQYTAKLVKESPDFMLAVNVTSANVCFWYLPKADGTRSKIQNAIKSKQNQDKQLGSILQPYSDILDRSVKDMYKKMQERGNVLLNHNPISEQKLPRCFRLVLNAPVVSESLVSEVLDEIRTCAKVSGWQ